MSRERFHVRVYKEYFNFASAHFLIFADGTREELHGHNYRVRVSAEGPLDEGDLVIDFTRLKPLVKSVCDQLDHRVILPLRHEALDVRRDGDSIVAVFRGADRFSFPARDVVLLDIRNTSTERLAEHLAAKIVARVREAVPGAKLEWIEVEVEESTGQCGVYSVRLD